MMNVTGRLLVSGALSIAAAQILLVAPTAVLAQTPMGTTFTYQGKITLNNIPIEGTDCCFDVSLWDAALNGTMLGTWGICGPDVSEGLFTLPVDFGQDVFDGTARWLEIAVCCQPPDDCSLLANYTTLTPRQKVTPAPHALALPGLWTQQNSTSPNLIGGFSGNTVTSAAVGATIGGGGHSADINRVTDEYGTVAGGSSNQAGNGDADTTNATHATVGGGRLNVAGGFSSTVSGGIGNHATGSIAAIGGGSGNVANNTESVVAGGLSNSATGPTSAVLGGFDNTASGLSSAVGGGVDNLAAGTQSVVPGGRSNTAAGTHSMAAGQRAKANHAGTFVWADTTVADFASTGQNQFLIRANGGVGIGTAAPQDQVHLKSGVSNRLLVETTETAPFHFAGVKALTPTMDYFFGACQGCLGGAGTHWEVFDNLANKTRLRIDAQGKIGIGTTTPAATLDVAGTGRFLGSSTGGLLTVAQTGTGPAMFVSGSGGSGPAMDVKGTVKLGDSSSVNALDVWGNKGVSISNSTAYSRAAVPGGSLIVQGNVGIGTTSPSEKLQVIGRIHSTSGGFRFPDGTVQTTAAGGGNHAGIASQRIGASIGLPLGMVDVETVTITTPASGHVVVEGKCYVELIGTTGPNQARVQIDAAPGGTATVPYYVQAGLDRYLTTGPNFFPVYVTRVFSVGAGTFTYRLEAQHVGPGGAFAFHPVLTATYYPTTYGATVPASASSGDAARELDILTDLQRDATVDEQVVSDAASDYVALNGLVENLERQNEELQARLTALEELVSARRDMEVGGDR